MSEAVQAKSRVATTATRVRYPETDRMGVVHHTHYFVWFELGRTELMRGVGCAYGDLEDRDGVFFPVIEAGAVYRAPALYDEVVAIETRLVAVSGARVRFEYAVRREGGEVLATGFTVHASCGRDGKPARLPERVRALLAGAGEAR